MASYFVSVNILDISDEWARPSGVFVSLLGFYE